MTTIVVEIIRERRDMASLKNRLGAAIGLALAAATLGGCVDDGYGYGGVSAGYGPGGYYDEGYGPGYAGDYGGYGYGGYDGYGYGGYGWYDGFYYPGTGFYVYDRIGHRHRWNDRQRGYWESRHHDRGFAGPAGGRGPDGRGDRRGFPAAGIAGQPGSSQVPSDYRRRRLDGVPGETDAQRQQRFQQYQQQRGVRAGGAVPTGAAPPQRAPQGMRGPAAVQRGGATGGGGHHGGRRGG